MAPEEQWAAFEPTFDAITASITFSAGGGSAQ
jgi:hypothetical protein